MELVNEFLRNLGIVCLAVMIVAIPISRSWAKSEKEHIKRLNKILEKK